MSYANRSFPTGLTAAQVTEQITGEVPALITAQVPDPLTIAKGGTGTSAATFQGRAQFRRQMGLMRQLVIPIETGGVAATVTGSVHKNLFENGNIYLQVLSGTAGCGRWTPGNSNASSGPSFFPTGTGLNSINWDKSWALQVVMANRLATLASALNTGRLTIIVGKPEAPVAGSTHPLTAKGVSVKLLGRNGSTLATDISTCAYATTENAGTTTQVTNTFTRRSFYDIEYIAGVGFYVYRDGTLVSQITNAAHLPSGSSALNENLLSFLFENIVAGASVACTNFITHVSLFTED